MVTGVGSIVDRLGVRESWIPDTGRKLLRIGMLGPVVAISIDEDRLKREAKLERFDFELSARTGDCLLEDTLEEIWQSADVASEEARGSS